LSPLAGFISSSTQWEHVFAVVCIFVARRILSRTIDERLAKAERKAAI